MRRSLGISVVKKQHNDMTSQSKYPLLALALLLEVNLPPKVTDRGLT